MCELCGLPLEQKKAKGRPKIYCSENCRRQKYNKNHIGVQHRLICMFCSTAFDWTRLRSGRMPKYCSSRCGSRANHQRQIADGRRALHVAKRLAKQRADTEAKRQQPQICELCRQSFKASQKRRFCSLFCQRHRRCECGNLKWVNSPKCIECHPHNRPQQPRTCPTCGVVFTKQGAARQVYCSKPCAGAGRTARKKTRLSGWLWILPCRQCTAWMVTKAKGKKYCSQRCWAKAHPSYVPKKQICIVCGRPWRECKPRCKTDTTLRKMLVGDTSLRPEELPDGYIEAVKALRQLNQEASRRYGR